MPNTNRRGLFCILDLSQVSIKGTAYIVDIVGRLVVIDSVGVFNRFAVEQVVFDGFANVDFSIEMVACYDFVEKG